MAGVCVAKANTGPNSLTPPAAHEPNKHIWTMKFHKNNEFLKMSLCESKIM